MITELDKAFEQSSNQYMKQNIKTGRRESNHSTSTNTLSFSSWTKDQFEKLKFTCKERNIDLNFSLEQLRSEIMESKSEQLRDCLKNYSESNYHTEYFPTIDRIDFDKPFDINNLEIISWKEKRTKWNKFFSSSNKGKSLNIQKRPVKCLTLKGEEVKTYSSISEAKKYLKATGHDNRITECCEGLRESVYGFKWEWAENNIQPDTLF